jgi:hypothetical protein
LKTVFWTLVCLLFLKVFVTILMGYVDYWPPNFNRGFLIGRGEYFYGVYQFAFYAHVIVGPAALILGTLLFFSGKNHSGWLAKRCSHRRLGRIQAFVVLFGVVPSVIIMAWPSFIEFSAGVGLMAQAVATGIAMTLAVCHAIKHDFASHQTWATRCYLLLLSPLILRIATWIIPLAIHEIARIQSNQNKQYTNPRRSLTNLQL